MDHTPLVGVRKIALSCGSGVETDSGVATDSYIYLHGSIDFCFDLKSLVGIGVVILECNFMVLTLDQGAFQPTMIF